MVRIAPLAAGDRAQAAGLLARAMADNPLHVRVFGTDEARRQRRLRHLFSALLDHVQAHGELLGAFVAPASDVSSDHRGQLVGVLGLIRPGKCRPGVLARLTLGTRIIASLPPWTGWQVRRWLSAWERHHPRFPHWHIGPLGVAAESRRQGIATRPMQEGCSMIDTAPPAPAWLETDLADNARFYQRFGFVTAGRKTVLGVENWFMIREPDRAELAPSSR